MKLLSYFSSVLVDLKTDLVKSLVEVIGNGNSYFLETPVNGGFEPTVIFSEVGRVNTFISSNCISVYKLAVDGDGKLEVYFSYPDSGICYCFRESENPVDIYHIAFECLMTLYACVKRGIRNGMANELRELVMSAGGPVEIGKNYEFLCADDNSADDMQGDYSDFSTSLLLGFSLNERGELLVNTTWCENGERYDYPLDCILFEDLRNVLPLVRDKVQDKDV